MTNPFWPDPPHFGYPTSNPRLPILISVIFMVEMDVMIFFSIVFILFHIICAYSHIIFIYFMFCMHKSRRFVIICEPSVNLYTMSIWVSIHIYIFFYIFVYLFCCLPNKLNIISIIIIIIIYYYIIYKLNTSQNRW